MTIDTQSESTSPTAKASSWDQYVDLLRPAGALVDTIPGPPSEQIRADLYRQFAMSLSQGYFLHFQSDPMHPEWSPCWNSVFLSQPNPDDVYYYAPIEGSGVYRVVGERGTSPIVTFTVGKYMFGLAGDPVPNFKDVELDDLLLDKDGNFEIVFSQERPADYSGNWIHLNPESKYILVRQRSYDWGHEKDVRLAIERLNAPALKAHMTIDEIDANLRELFGNYVKRLSTVSLRFVDRTKNNRYVNKFTVETFHDEGAGNEWPQVYWMCIYDFADDEALILETELPKVHKYWNIQVSDALFNQVEMVYRQSSLNGHQARIDADGKFRAVVSVADPGIANWLDTGGNRYGMLIGRWYKCDSYPVPQLTKIKLAHLGARLPASTPQISSKEREEALRVRRVGAQLRRRW